MTNHHLPALSVRQLSYAYGGKKALDHVGFTVMPGECTILLGPNGAGKSTLFALITRLYDSRDGHIDIAGFDIKRQTARALSRLGVVFQQPTLDLDLSVEQNLRYHCALHGMSRRQAEVRILEELQRFGLLERRQEKVRQLNGGHRRRVEIVRALLHQPDVLLLDEPTVGLDVSSRQAMVRHVHDLCRERGIAVLWATHLIDEIGERDKLVVLHHGRVRALGTMPEVLEMAQARDIAQAFQQLTREVV